MAEDQQRAMLRKYLLGELPERERSQLAARYFVDEDLFDELLDVENKLLRKKELHCFPSFSTRFTSHGQS